MFDSVKKFVSDGFGDQPKVPDLDPVLGRFNTKLDSETAPKKVEPNKPAAPMVIDGAGSVKSAPAPIDAASFRTEIENMSSLSSSQQLIAIDFLKNAKNGTITPDKKEKEMSDEDHKRLCKDVIAYLKSIQNPRGSDGKINDQKAIYVGDVLVLLKDVKAVFDAREAGKAAATYKMKADIASLLRGMKASDFSGTPEFYRAHPKSLQAIYSILVAEGLLSTTSSAPLEYNDDTKKAVIKLQERMKKTLDNHGKPYYTGEINGVFGPEMLIAYRQYSNMVDADSEKKAAEARKKDAEAKAAKKLPETKRPPEKTPEEKMAESKAAVITMLNNSDITTVKIEKFYASETEAIKQNQYLNFSADGQTFQIIVNNDGTGVFRQNTAGAWEGLQSDGIIWKKGWAAYVDLTKIGAAIESVRRNSPERKIKTIMGMIPLMGLAWNSKDFMLDSTKAYKFNTLLIGKSTPAKVIVDMNSGDIRVERISPSGVLRKTGEWGAPSDADTVLNLDSFRQAITKAAGTPAPKIGGAPVTGVGTELPEAIVATASSVAETPSKKSEQSIISLLASLDVRGAGSNTPFIVKVAGRDDIVIGVDTGGNISAYSGDMVLTDRGWTGKGANPAPSIQLGIVKGALETAVAEGKIKVAAESMRNGIKVEAKGLPDAITYDSTTSEVRGLYVFFKSWTDKPGIVVDPTTKQARWSIKIGSVTYTPTAQWDEGSKKLTLNFKSDAPNPTAGTTPPPVVATPGKPWSGDLPDEK